MFFADSEVDKILGVWEKREKQAREDYFAYFSEVALEYYENLIAEKKEQILNSMVNAAICGPILSTIRVPLNTVWTHEAISPTNREARRLYENQHYNSGAWFESPACVHRANIHAIFKHSDFKQRMDARLGRGMFLTMTSKLVRSSVAGVNEYEVTIWINLALSK
jgi:hypothetical protein